MHSNIIDLSSYPVSLTITSPVTLTWLTPASDLNCSFNYTFNITNSSSVTERMYSNSTSLILTDFTHGENYSFAVAITDSTGQHGPWSEELRVTWDGEYIAFVYIIAMVVMSEILNCSSSVICELWYTLS